MIWKWWEQAGRAKYHLEEANNLVASNKTKTALVAATAAQAHAILALTEAVAEAAQILHEDLKTLNKRLEGRKC